MVWSKLQNRRICNYIYIQISKYKYVSKNYTERYLEPSEFYPLVISKIITNKMWV